jgi:hypothetical protein
MIGDVHFVIIPDDLRRTVRANTIHAHAPVGDHPAQRLSLGGGKQFRESIQEGR